MGLLPDSQNCGLRMRRECRERFACHRLLRKPLVSDPGMHHGTCVTHVPWCMSGSLSRGGGENVHGIPGACATQFYVSRKRPMHCGITWLVGIPTIFQRPMTVPWTAPRPGKFPTARAVLGDYNSLHVFGLPMSRVSCQKGPICHA